LRTGFINELQPTDFPNIIRLDVISPSDTQNNYIGVRQLAWLVLAELDLAFLALERPASYLERFVLPHLRVLRVELDLNLDAGAMFQLVARLFPAIRNLDVCVRAHKTTDLRSTFHTYAHSSQPILPKLASLTLRWTSPSRSASAQIVASCDLKGFAKRHTVLDVVRVCQKLDHDGGTGSRFWGYMSWFVQRRTGVNSGENCGSEVQVQDVLWSTACDITRTHLPYSEQELGGAPWDFYDV